MNNINLIKSLLDRIREGNLIDLNNYSISLINQETLSLMSSDLSIEQNKMEAHMILEISNIIYNNTDKDLLPLDDGIYDLLLEKYKKVDPSYQIGSEVIHFNSFEDDKEILKPNGKIEIMKKIPLEKVNEFIHKDTFLNVFNSSKANYLIPIMRKETRQMTISKRSVSIPHEYPKLVGTLDKCKFTLVSEAKERNIDMNDPKILIFERDFFGKHVKMGLINQQYGEIEVEASIKYDGVSIEATVTTEILLATGRGDVNNNLGADYTPIFKGYQFPRAPKELRFKEPFGIKFEAIMTKNNLSIYNQITGKNYKNGRTAIIGILGSSDAPKYRDLITLVPIETSIEGISREDEVNFLNKYYTRDIYFMRSIIRGSYTQVLYSINRFVKEAEFMRPFIPFMYDGVVINYTDINLRKALGRVNSVNKYAMAIKFTTLKRLTTFRGYNYTVGQNGEVTPMILYDPIEFYGAIHTKSSGHSYKRFKELGLRYGDIIEVEYTNDVMPYVTKPDNSHNASNDNPIIEFIDTCPYCGSKLVVSETGKTIYCTNIKCPQRVIKRVANMMDKLHLNDFAEANLEKMNITSFTQFIHTKKEDVLFMGDIMAQKFIDRIKEITTKPIYDYVIIGALGIENIAQAKWKMILNKYSLRDIMNMNENELKEKISSIKGLGGSTCETLIESLEIYKEDLITISNMTNIITTKGNGKQLKIRFSGFRDNELVELLSAKGVDIGEGSVTKDTDILLIPTRDHTSTKVDKANKYNESGANINIIDIDTFMSETINNLRG